VCRREAKKGDQAIAFVAIDLPAVPIDLGPQELEHVRHDLDPALDVDPSSQGAYAST
jgi:hypothetical protein